MNAAVAIAVVELLLLVVATVFGIHFYLKSKGAAGGAAELADQAEELAKAKASTDASAATENAVEDVQAVQDAAAKKEPKNALIDTLRRLGGG